MRGIAAAAGMAVAALALAAGVYSRPAPPVKPPKPGQYSGGTDQHRELLLYVSGRSIQIVAFDYGCGATQARTSLNDIAMRKTKKGYRFAIEAHGSVSFSDGAADENAAISISGRFTRRANAVSGTLRVKNPRCHDTGPRKWSAKR